jgi:hypothetical protein
VQCCGDAGDEGCAGGGRGQWQGCNKAEVCLVCQELVEEQRDGPCSSSMPMAPKRLSPPASGTSWTDWSHAWGGEMHLRKVLEKLNLEYPHDSDD